ncbi:MAG: hypothetical protein QM753_08540 [Thermomicrobiales bacterium]
MIVHHQQQFQNALMRGPVSVLARIQARPLLDRDGKPFVIEGDRMLAAKTQSREGRTFAMLIACDPSRDDSYADRAPGLRRLALTRLSAHIPGDFESVPNGIELDGRMIDVTVAAWVNGPSLLDAATRLASEAKPSVLRALAGSVAKAINDFRGGSFAHDTFNPGNAIVGEGGTLVFVGLSRATWDGGPGPSASQTVHAYRHPDGDGDPFAEDAFAGLVIYASLLVLADDPSLLSSDRGVTADSRPLVFSHRDLADPDASPVFARVLAVTSPETREVVDALRAAASAPADEIERWAAVIPGFRRIDLPSYLRSRPDGESRTGTPAASPSAQGWGTPAASWEPETSPDAPWPGVPEPEPERWQSWRPEPRGVSGTTAQPVTQGASAWPEEPAQRRAAPPAPLERAPRRQSPRERLVSRPDARPVVSSPVDVAESERRVQDEAGRQRARKEFFAALSARDEAAVRALWPQMATDPVGRTATLAVQDLVGRGLRERIRSEQRMGRHESAAIIAESASTSGIPIEPEVRRRLRATQHRVLTRERLEASLNANDLDQLAELAVSGELLELDDTDRQTIQRVLRAVKWPALADALATDDDRIIVDAFDPDLWDEGRALSPEARTRIGQALARIDWRGQVRQALRNRDAAALESLFLRPPAAAIDRLSTSERRRCRRLIEQRHALAELHRAVDGLDDDAIVRALNHVERVGARITDRETWVAIQQIVERTSMVEDLVAAVDADPMEVGKLAHLVPAARTMGYDRDPRLRGRYALDELERILVQHAHLRRVRAALEKGDDAGIVLVAVPDPYGALDLLDDGERSRIAQAIQSQRRIDRKGVEARFRSATPA